MPDNSSAAVSQHAASERLLVVDYRNLAILWTEEKIARHELSMKEADDILQKKKHKESSGLDQ